MDPLTELLAGVRARGALFHQSFLPSPWALRLDCGTPLALASMVHGTAWVLPDDGSPVRLNPGDVAILRGAAPYTVADSPAPSAGDVVLHSGDSCTGPDGAELAADLSLSTRSWGAREDGAAVLLSGMYQVEGDVGSRLLAALPPVLTVEQCMTDCPLSPVIAEEIARDEPGQQAVLDRLLDLLLLATLRSWFNGNEAHAPAWYRAHGDPVVGQALRLLHADPAHPWTVGALAAKAGTSRATLARRFTALVGEPPMSYLTDWRLTLAADLLRTPGATLGSVARQVGYADAFSLSAAFKRTRGVSPRAHLHATATPPPAGPTAPGRLIGARARPATAAVAGRAGTTSR
ncbi:AraC family transcriptional regulator [Streptomyces sp. ACA25]|uniref:AraC family transcriptional regulator n=1 Tax=Streptomyces sp. ACA25 TaxID=3022596 RepID=UPI002307BD1C|nr:AraC family transcriptional regulator [Streptomyces sp. ACA25]MDB1088270.1 AraC family transcriptional regulator [Streptomyces sp. ACA25]